MCSISSSRLVQVDVFNHKLSLAGIGQHLLGQISRTCCGRFDLLQALNNR